MKNHASNQKYWYENGQTKLGVCWVLLMAASSRVQVALEATHTIQKRQDIYTPHHNTNHDRSSVRIVFCIFLKNKAHKQLISDYDILHEFKEFDNYEGFKLKCFFFSYLYVLLD